MAFIEAPSNFYLGRYYNPATQSSKAHISDEIVYYESRHLTTHAVVVGMTGSGKTGLCITLLEEAVLDQIPIIVIDPKGDITNLLLAFPDLQPQSFLPWINTADAGQAGMRPEQFAQDIAQRWQEGLKSWEINPRRLADYRDNAYFSIYTPGSDAGLPISILAAMTAPREGWAGYEEYHREHIRALTTAILTLVGYKPNPVKDREHVLIANIFEYAWRNGYDLTMQDIILQVQKPPFNKLGVFDIETFFPEKDRFKLAMELNNIIASPSFQSWMQGDPLDFQNMLYVQTPRGPKPRVNIFYVAHLSEEERTFIITLILESILTGMRSLSGTSSLRAVVYFDEVFGHFPPYPKNPPTKDPLLRLLKQARAFGIGMVLATQNPGDLDYKGLSNAGTWFIGRLQTENDKKRVLDGLTTASTTANKLDVPTLDKLISSVDPRVFVMNNVHDPRGPRLIHSRWAMSYLGGPLTRDQIRMLTDYQQQLNARLLGGYPQSPAALPGSYAAPPQYAPPPPQFVPPAAPMFQPPPPPQFAPPPPAPQFVPAPGGLAAQQPPVPSGSTPPPPTLPETPGIKPSSAPPPPPKLPESTAAFAQSVSSYQPPPALNQPVGTAAYAPAQYQPPAAPYQGNTPTNYSPVQYQVPAAPYQGANPTGYAPAQYQAPVAPYQSGSPTGYSPAQYQPPVAPYQGGSATGYSPAQYQAPSAPYQGKSADVYAPAQYQVPSAPYGGAYVPPAASTPAWEVANAPSSGPVDAGQRTGTAAQATASQAVDMTGSVRRLPGGFSDKRPPVPSTIEQYFLPNVISVQQAIGRWERNNRIRANEVGDILLGYLPFLLAQLQVRYLDQKTNINSIETYAYHIYDLQRSGLVHWDQYVARPVLTTSVYPEPADETAVYGEASPGLTDRTRLTALKKEIVDYVAKTVGLTIPYNPVLKIFGVPGMTFRDFQAQVVAAAREARDREIDQVTAKFEREFDRLEEKYRREERELRADQAEHKELGREELFTWGEAALSLLQGRTAYTLSRVSRARRYKGQAKEGVRESYEVISDIEAQMDDLQKRYEYELNQVNGKWNQVANQAQEVRITPAKKDIHPELFGMGWMPEYIVVINGREERLPAWEGTGDRQRQVQAPPAQQALPPSGYSQPSQPYTAQTPAYDQGDPGYTISYDDRRSDQDYDDGNYYQPNY